MRRCRRCSRGSRCTRTSATTSPCPWNLFLKHLDALASERVNCLQVVTPYENEFDVTGGMYKVNYAGVIETLVEETVAAFIDVGAGR